DDAVAGPVDASALLRAGLVVLVVCDCDRARLIHLAGGLRFRARVRDAAQRRRRCLRRVQPGLQRVELALLRLDLRALCGELFLERGDGRREVLPAGGHGEGAGADGDKDGCYASCRAIEHGDSLTTGAEGYANANEKVKLNETYSHLCDMEIGGSRRRS